MTISQNSGGLGGEEIGQDKETEKKKDEDEKRAGYWQNNQMPSDMVLKLLLSSFFWPSKVLNCT